jgi:hypothetical protein
MPSVVVLATLLLQQQQLPPTAQVAGPPPLAEAVVSDTGALRHRNGRVPPVANAVRSTSAPRIDGRPDDAVWALARPLTQFTQRQPLDGQPASESTAVRLAYDDDAIYVFARMYDSQPARIASRLARRDGDAQSDMFEVDIDSYHDQRTAFGFSVTPLGVKGDAVYSNDVYTGDDSWDAVWDVATQRDSLGWTAEFRIPLSQLRFPNAATQIWGVNFVRLVRRKAEISAWSWWAQTDEGFASYFGHAFGIASLPQPQRLEFLPYITGSEERLASGSPENPFNDGSREVGRAGLDLKYGLASNLTLNATVNPDFGQVEADPAEVNLTAYETFFSERRPFFVEGADIFSGGNQQYLYSRRIGRAPQASAEYRGGPAFTDEPTSTSILGAAKLSGRTAGGWSVGLIEAVTAREYAAVDSAGARFRDEVEPLTNYAVVRAKRDFRGGASTIGLIGTAVNRRIDDARLDFLRSSAYAGGVDLSHRFSRNRFRVTASLGYSYIGGDTAAIRRAQTSSARYFDRPDASYVDLDPTRTSLMGWTGALGFARIQGNYTYSVSASATSPGFEINDLGYQTRADRVTLSASGTRRWTRPGRVFRSANVSLQTETEWNFGQVRAGTFLGVSVGGQFLNYWNANVNLALQPRSADDGLTRGGPLGITPASYNISLSAKTDSRKPWSIMLDGCFGRTEAGGWNRGVLTEIELRPTPGVSLSATGHYYTERSTRQYLEWQTDPVATATFGRQYIFADMELRNLDVTARLNVTLSPTLSLQLYAQPFVFIADYGRFKELAAARTSNYTVYGEAPGSVLLDSTRTAGYFLADADGAGPRAAVRIADPDFSARSLRGNAVLRWEYRPGSTLFLVWTNSCEAYGADATFRIGNNLTHLCEGRSNNVVAVKLNYWLSL